MVFKPGYPAIKSLVNGGQTGSSEVLLLACIVYSSCFHCSTGLCQYDGPEHDVPWWAATGPQLLLNILNITCDRASLTLYMSIDLVMIQRDTGVLFGVVKILKPTHIFNNNNCKKIMLSTPAESLLCLSSCYKHFHFSRPCDINIIIIPTLQRRKPRHNLKKLATQWWCECRINWGS